MVLKLSYRKSSTQNHTSKESKLVLTHAVFLNAKNDIPHNHE